MKKPLFDQFERLVLRGDDCFYRQRLLLSIEVMKFKRNIDKVISPPLEYLLDGLVSIINKMK